MARRTKRTPEKAAAFLAALRDCGNITAAAERAALGRRTVYEWRDEDPAFAAEMEAAYQEAADRLETEAKRRAVEGVEEPVYQGGKQVGTIRRYSDTLLIFLLNGARPEKYRQRHELTGKDGGGIEHKITVSLGDLSDEELAVIARLAAGKRPETGA